MKEIKVKINGTEVKNPQEVEVIANHDFPGFLVMKQRYSEDGYEGFLKYATSLSSDEYIDVTDPQDLLESLLRIINEKIEQKQYDNISLIKIKYVDEDIEEIEVKLIGEKILRFILENLRVSSLSSYGEKIKMIEIEEKQ